MTYAGQRTILDADSHIMELADFLDAYIDEDQRDRLRRRGMDALAPVLEKAADKAASRRADPAKAAEAEERLWSDKGWQALGAFDPDERRRALDLMEQHQVRRIPILDEKDRLVGIISQADIAIRFEEPEKTAEVVEEIRRPEDGVGRRRLVHHRYPRPARSELAAQAVGGKRRPVRHTRHRSGGSDHLHLSAGRLPH